MHRRAFLEAVALGGAAALAPSRAYSFLWSNPLGLVSVPLFALVAPGVVHVGRFSKAIEMRARDEGELRAAGWLTSLADLADGSRPCRATAHGPRVLALGSSFSQAGKIDLDLPVLLDPRSADVHLRRIGASP